MLVGVGCPQNYADGVRDTLHAVCKALASQVKELPSPETVVVRLTNFLYLLMCNELPFGDVAVLIGSCPEDGGVISMADGVGAYARDLALRLLDHGSK